MAHSNRRVPASIAWLLVAVLSAVAHAVSEETTDLNGDGLVGEDPAPAGFPCPGGGGSPGFMLAVEWHGNAFLINGETGEDTPLGNTGFTNLNSLARNSRGEFYTVRSNPNFPDDEQLLLTVDPQTGEGTVVTVLDLEGVPNVSIRAMAFSPTDELYAIHIAPGTFALLYRIGIETGVGEFIGDPAASGTST